MKASSLLRFKFVCLALLLITISLYAPYARHRDATRADTRSARVAFIKSRRLGRDQVNAEKITRVVPGEIAFSEEWSPQPGSTERRVLDTGLGEGPQHVRLDEAVISEPEVSGYKNPRRAPGRPMLDGVGGERYLAAELAEFVDLVATGQEDTVVGVFVVGGFSLPVEQQPAGDPGHVTNKDGVATQFKLAADNGSIGLLAHNDLGGENFFNLLMGQKIYVIYGDGSTETYEVSDIRRYQARQPNSPYSSFFDLDSDTAELSVVDLFYEIYGDTDRLVFQTCIEEDGIDTWGRYFVIAHGVTRGIASEPLLDDISF